MPKEELWSRSYRRQNHLETKTEKPDYKIPLISSDTANDQTSRQMVFFKGAPNACCNVTKARNNSSRGCFDGIIEHKE